LRSGYVYQSQAQSSRPTFDVATITLSQKQGAGDTGLLYTLPDGRFTATAVTLRTLIFSAYELNHYSQLVGGPDWINTTRWNLEARALGRPASREMSLMLQSFLESKFRLKLHKEQRELSIDAGQQKEGLKLEPAKGPVEVLVIDFVQRPTEN
jgi:uncharacterized protein (TIGR03435 family)